MRVFVKILLFLVVLYCASAEAIEIPETPKTPVKRIVSLAPSCTEILAGLNVQDRLVGVTQHTDYPPEVLNLPVVGSYVNLNVEAIVSLKPDLVVATDDGNPLEILERLKEFSIAVFVLNLRTYESIQESILALGNFLSAETAAKQQVDQMTRVANCIRAKTGNFDKPSVLFVYQSYPIVTAGKGTFTDQLIEMAGGESITHDVSLSYPRLTIENIIAKNPDVIIDSSMDPTAEKELKLKWWKQWGTLKAVKNNRVYVLESKNLDRPSQRIVYGFLQLARTLHPELLPDDTCLTKE
ncbi:cobalamin-binding protein [bacterium]|nr:cobalamin-binding protein [bacterium]